MDDIAFAGRKILVTLPFAMDKLNGIRWSEPDLSRHTVVKVPVAEKHALAQVMLYERYEKSSLVNLAQLGNSIARGARYEHSLEQTKLRTKSRELLTPSLEGSFATGLK